MTPRNKGWREVRRERPGSYWWAAIGGMLLAAVVGLGWLTLGPGSRVAATDDEGAPNAEPCVEHDAIIYWEKNDIPADLPGTEPDESNLNLEPAPAVPATPKNGDGNEEWKGSGRVFPGLRYYGETNDSEGVPYADRRRRVLAVVKWVKGDAPDKVYFRLWDVDDPSDDDGPIDSDTHGPDNNDATGWHFAGEDGSHISEVPKGKVLRFKKGGGTELTDGEENCYKVEAEVGLRPGDNYRFAASAVKQELVDMTQAMADKAKRPATGRTSKILTVWRKLHLELDSMAAGEDNPIKNKNIDKTWDDDPHPGESTAEINAFEPNDNGRYEGGTLTVTAGGTYEIVDNWDPIWPGDDYVCVEGDITGDEDKSASFGDDDVCALPRKADWSLVNQKFAPAYIEAVEEPGVYNPDVPFNPTVMNGAEVVVPLATPKQNRDTSADYWVSLILSCHQGKTEDDGGGIKSSVDGDPDLYYHVHMTSWKEGDQSVLTGLTVPATDPEWGQNISLLFLEVFRETEAQYQQAQQENWPKIPRDTTAEDEEQITVVHELGWVFGWDHEDGPVGTPMQPSPSPSMEFNEDQIKCFRESEEIEQ